MIRRTLRRATRRTTLAQIRYLTPVGPDAAPPAVARVYAQVERDFGMLAPPVSLHAPAPGPLAAAWLMLRETLLATGQVRRGVKEAVAVSVSAANACPYCVEVHQVASHGLVPGGDQTDPERDRIAGWARASGRPIGAPPPFPAALAPELIGTAVTFHYLNRMVNLFLVDSPIPPRVPPAARRAIQRLAGRLLRPVFRAPVEPGGALDLLPAAELPADLSWAAGNRHIAGAYARAARAVDDAGHRSVPEPVRELVLARLADWDGQPPGPSGGWARDAAAGLPAEHRAAGRLALLTALASYQVGPSAIDEFRQLRPDDQCLVEAASWASLAAARRVGGWLWQGAAPR